MRKTVVSIALVLTMFTTCCQPVMSQEVRQTSWNLGDIYSSSNEAEKAVTKIQDEITQMASYRGKLNSANTIADWYALNDEYEGDITRLEAYAQMQTSLNAGDSNAQTLLGRAEKLNTDYSKATSFASSEIFAESDEFLDSVSKDARMAPYLVTFQRQREESSHILPENEENLLLPLYNLTNGATNLFDRLCYLEMPRQQILFPDGVTRTANENNYLLALFGGFDQNFRLQYSNTMLSSYTAFRNTYAQNFENYCTGVSETAKAHGYSSALEASLVSDNVDSSLYEAVIKASLDSKDLTDNYAALIKNELGLDEIYSFDLNIPMAKDPGITYTYDEACELVLKALAPLGEKYVADARTALKGGWVDVYSADGKASGAYSMEVPGVHPYILLNFGGTFSDVSTLAMSLGIR